MNLEYGVSITDAHCGDEDQKAYSCWLNVSASLKNLKEIFILGDFIDFPSISRWRNSPSLAQQLVKDNIAIANARLDQLDKEFPGVNKKYIEGNHEVRLHHYICEKAPHLYGLIDLPSLLRMNTRPLWKYVHFGPHQMERIMGLDLFARHCPLKQGEHFAKNTAKVAGCNLIFGHLHQPQRAQHMALNGQIFMAKCSGWLGNAEAESAQYVDNRANWAQGFDVIEKYGKYWWDHTVAIKEGKTSFNGRLFQA